MGWRARFPYPEMPDHVHAQQGRPSTVKSVGGEWSTSGKSIYISLALFSLVIQNSLSAVGAHGDAAILGSLSKILYLGQFLSRTQYCMSHSKRWFDSICCYPKKKKSLFKPTFTGHWTLRYIHFPRSHVESTIRPYPKAAAQAPIVPTTTSFQAGHYSLERMSSYPSTSSPTYKQ